MSNNEASIEYAKFIAEYAAHQMGCGIHTSRVVRNTKRIGEALHRDVTISVFQKSIILTVHEQDTNHILSEVIEIPALPISFRHNAELSALSWEALDRKLDLETIKLKFHEIISAPRINFWIVLLLVGFANTSLCRLFKGDWTSVALVFLGTLAGFFVRFQLQKRKINHYLVFIVSAFVASAVASTTLLLENVTSDIALATSVLYLVPGVPLINSVIDIVEGHTLTGLSRFANALLLIVCLAIGLSITLVLFKGSLI